MGNFLTSLAQFQAREEELRQRDESRDLAVSPPVSTPISAAA